MNKVYWFGISLCLLIIAYLLSFQKNTHALTWTSINVSHTVQGDAHIIRKDGKVFLIDTGSHKESKTSLLPYLVIPEKPNNLPKIGTLEVI